MRRGRLEIISDILKVSRRGAKKTEIMYGANLSFEQLQKYLSFLRKRGLMNEENNGGKIRYKTSEIGGKVLGAYKKIDNLINNQE